MIRTSRKKVLFCVDPVLKFELKCTDSCCSGKFRVEWHHENGSLIKIFTFRSLEHLTLQAFPSPAKRRAAAHISPQPAFSGVPPEPPVFTVYQEEPTRQCGVYAAQAARPPALEERSGLQTQSFRKHCAGWRQFGKTLETCCTPSKIIHLLVIATPINVELGRARESAQKWKRWKMPSNSYCRGDNLLAARRGYAAMSPEKETVRFNCCHALFPFILSSLIANRVFGAPV